MLSDQLSVVDPTIFESLQVKIDQDAEIREQLKSIIQELEKQARRSQAILARAHSTPAAKIQIITSDAELPIRQQIRTIQKLAVTASKYPYYKYQTIWSRDLQNTVYLILLCSYLGGLCEEVEMASQGRLLAIDDIGKLLEIPVNMKDEDIFHISIEDYLLALILLVEELARLAVNSVTLGDYERPLHINHFIKDLHAGFQLLNLKNDSLRRRSDGIKYSVKKVEDVVYDLSLRSLIPKST